MAHEPGSLVGAVVGGKFKLRRLIGSGGMGEVYAAESAGARVAIKVLHEKAAKDKDLVARFHREAYIAAQIHSPFIATILAAGKDPDGRLWIAFELLSGEGLDERLRREHYLSFADVAPIVDDALQGLRAAHGNGVIHRDIKPANLFIEKRRLTAAEIRNDESEERTRILDFGVSKIRAGSGHRAEPTITAFDATLGSLAYMAPEQVRGSARVDERADLYALGAVAFRALAGRLPFEGQNALTLVALKLDRDPPQLSNVTGDDWPAPIERFFAKIMARDRDKRFAEAGDALSSWRKVCRLMGDAPRRRARTVPVREERTDVTARTFTGETSASKVGSRS
jgi:eukaryotic-like serine/threonine-protein kinase